MDKITLPLVTIVIPCRNEEKHIAKCLDAVLAQDYPGGRFEIIVVDGASTDGTRRILESYAKKDRRIRMLDNEKIFTPFAFNLGIQSAKGEVVAIMGAHADYQNDYLSKCVYYLNEYGADNVGGRMITLSRNGTIMGKAIVRALSSPFGVGDSHFRMKSNEPKWVDTVFGGCYRKEIFDKIGFFNEKLTRGQDMEFNVRLKKSGGKILLAPDIICRYYARSDLKDFFIHDFYGGTWVIFSRKFTKESLRLRHYLPASCFLFAVLFAVAGFFWPGFWPVLWFLAAFYILLSLFFSVKISVKERDWRYAFLMPVAFGSRHLAYALGSMNGFLKLIFTK
ncbi:MAG: glycosyltransferase family 2 protein [Candidatus Nealsonbacteria bacterium DGGOD1a]|nr:MAG: glycosyltransferase family 2 protein [Candidatus Nealsonbacteria bacterium DGGOD1a]